MFAVVIDIYNYSFAINLAHNVKAYFFVNTNSLIKK